MGDIFFRRITYSSKLDCYEKLLNQIFFTIFKFIQQSNSKKNEIQGNNNISNFDIFKRLYPLMRYILAGITKMNIHLIKICFYENDFNALFYTLKNVFGSQYSFAS